MMHLFLNFNTLWHFVIYHTKNKIKVLYFLYFRRTIIILSVCAHHCALHGTVATVIQRAPKKTSIFYFFSNDSCQKLTVLNDFRTRNRKKINVIYYHHLFIYDVYVIFLSVIKSLKKQINEFEQMVGLTFDADFPRIRTPGLLSTFDPALLPSI